MSTSKYLNGNGLSEVWTNTKNYVYSQLLGKADASHTHTKSQITDLDLSNYVDKTSNQTVAGNKEFTGTTTAHDLVPSATDTYNFGSPSVQWNNAYIKSLTINGVACGDILTHNASEFVKVTGNQTIAGAKTFSSDIRISKTSPFCNVFSSGYIKGQAPTSNIYSGVRFFDDINSGSTNNITGGFEVEYNRDGYNKSYISSRNYAGETHKLFTVGLRVPNDDIRSIDFLPSVSAIVNLGTSTNKWKSVYSNSYYLGTTAFGDIVTHNASEFVHANDLATVATSGSYNDLTDLPTIPSPYTPPTFTYDSSTETLTVSNTTATVFNYDSNTETLEIQING